jgi:hypothetical protein
LGMRSNASESVVLSDKAKAFMSGEFLNAYSLGSVLEACLIEATGPSGLAMEHIRKLQSEAPNAPSTVEKKGAGKGVFEDSGASIAAVSQVIRPGELVGSAPVLRFGSSADIHAGQLKSAAYRMNRNGIYAQIRVTGRGATLTAGFVGKLKHSRAFNKVRRETQKALGLSHKLSVGRTEDAMRKANRVPGMGAKIRKFSAKGSLGIRAGKHVLARGGDNLGYANVVQSGEFKGVRGASGKLYDPRTAAGLRRNKKFEGGKAEFGKARPVFPARAGDIGRLAAAANRAMDRRLTALGLAA